MIRKLKKEDLNTVMDIWISSNLDCHYFIDENYWKDNFNMVADMMLKSDVYIYEKDENILGFIGLMNNYIAGIFVKKEFRNKGIGKKLLDFAKDKSPTLSLDVFELNKNAINFYKREGFCIVNEHINKDTEKVEYTMQYKS